ncbi:MAG: hypothetical protein J6X42_00045 [Alphaproteobacteria bacterium]|nr:hypothetical protein [Alphaproteobacteria bacterium]
MRNNIKMPKQVRHDNMQGRSMVEMLGVLAIIGVLSAGGLAGYSKAMFKHKLNSTMEQITMLVTNIRTMYGQQRTYSDLDNAAAVKLGIVPPIMGNSATLTNPFKGKVTIIGKADDAKAKSADTAAGTAFVVRYAGLPTEACIALATADFGSGAGSGFIGVDVAEASTVYVADARTLDANGSATKRGEGYAYLMSDAITACKATSDNATITWKFY